MATNSYGGPDPNFPELTSEEGSVTDLDPPQGQGQADQPGASSTPSQPATAAPPPGIGAEPERRGLFTANIGTPMQQADNPNELIILELMRKINDLTEKVVDLTSQVANAKSEQKDPNVAKEVDDVPKLNNKDMEKPAK